MHRTRQGNKLRPSFLQPLHTGVISSWLQGPRVEDTGPRPCSLQVPRNDPVSDRPLGTSRLSCPSAWCLCPPYLWEPDMVPRDWMPLPHSRATSNLLLLVPLSSPKCVHLFLPPVCMCVCVCVRTCVCVEMPRGKGPTWEGDTRISGALISKANPVGGLSQGPGSDVGHGRCSTDWGRSRCRSQSASGYKKSADCERTSVNIKGCQVDSRAAQGIVHQ